MTPDQWDTHWYRIRNSLLDDGYSDAAAMADQETTEQFGPRPRDAT